MEPVDLDFPHVTVHFIGICTHFTGKDDRAYPPGTLVPLVPSPRVVLVDGSNGLRVGKTGIPPHSALLYIAPRFIAPESIDRLERIDGLTKIAPELPSTWRMSGVHLELESGNTEVKWEPSFRCLPSLTAAVGHTDQPLRLDYRVINDGDLACVFCVTDGSVSAYVMPRDEPSPPVIGKVTVRMDDWEKAQLKVTRIWNQSASTIRLQRAGDEYPHIIIANVGTSEDVEADFTLHYLLTTLAPQDAIQQQRTCHPPQASPADRKALEEVRFMAVLAEGCSNSMYP